MAVNESVRQALELHVVPYLKPTLTRERFWQTEATLCSSDNLLLFGGPGANVYFDVVWPGDVKNIEALRRHLNAALQCLGDMSPEVREEICRLYWDEANDRTVLTAEGKSLLELPSEMRRSPFNRVPCLPRAYSPSDDLDAAMPLDAVLASVLYVLTGLDLHRKGPTRRDLLREVANLAKDAIMLVGQAKRAETWEKTALVWNVRGLWQRSTGEKPPVIASEGSPMWELIAALIDAFDRSWDIRATFKAYSRNRQRLIEWSLCRPRRQAERRR